MNSYVNEFVVNKSLEALGYNLDDEKTKELAQKVKNFIAEEEGQILDLADQVSLEFFLNTDNQEEICEQIAENLLIGYFGNKSKTGRKQFNYNDLLMELSSKIVARVVEKIEKGG